MQQIRKTSGHCAPFIASPSSFVKLGLVTCVSSVWISVLPCACAILLPAGRDRAMAVRGAVVEAGRGVRKDIAGRHVFLPHAFFRVVELESAVLQVVMQKQD